jgi:hypothetical protein
MFSLVLPEQVTLRITSLPLIPLIKCYIFVFRFPLSFHWRSLRCCFAPLFPFFLSSKAFPYCHLSPRLYYLNIPTVYSSIMSCFFSFQTLPSFIPSILFLTLFCSFPFLLSLSLFPLFYCSPLHHFSNFVYHFQPEFTVSCKYVFFFLFSFRLFHFFPLSIAFFFFQFIFSLFSLVSFFFHALRMSFTN